MGMSLSEMDRIKMTKSHMIQTGFNKSRKQSHPEETLEAKTAFQLLRQDIFYRILSSNVFFLLSILICNRGLSVELGCPKVKTFLNCQTKR